MLFSIQAMAESDLSQSLSHSATEAENQQAFEQNFQYNLDLEKNGSVRDLGIKLSRPVEEYAKFKYLLISAYESFSVDKTVFAKNLPNDVVLVVLTNNPESARNKYSKYLPEDRLIIAVDSTASVGFWARDSFPIPVLDNLGNPLLVGHKYFRNFYGNDALADSVGFRMVSENFVFVGGNLMADDKGQCITTNSSRLFGLSEKTLKQSFGCKAVKIMPWTTGIGDIDETVKLLPNNQALTNQQQLKPILESLGYTVTMLPDAGGYRTYANSLVLNGTVFMPSYNQPEDQTAKAIYESFGYKVVFLDSRVVSDQGMGSIHCMTMAYPEMNINRLLGSMGMTLFH